MGGDCSDAREVFFSNDAILKDFAKTKNRQKLHKFSLPDEKPQNYAIKRVSLTRHCLVVEPVGEVSELTELGTGKSDPYVGV